MKAEPCALLVFLFFFSLFLFSLLWLISWQPGVPCSDNSAKFGFHTDKQPVPSSILASKAWRAGRHRSQRGRGRGWEDLPSDQWQTSAVSQKVLHVTRDVPRGAFQCIKDFGSAWWAALMRWFPGCSQGAMWHEPKRWTLRNVGSTKHTKANQHWFVCCAFLTAPRRNHIDFG